jgi:hypothetical protein
MDILSVAASHCNNVPPQCGGRQGERRKNLLMNFASTWPQGTPEPANALHPQRDRVGRNRPGPYGRSGGAAHQVSRGVTQKVAHHRHLAVSKRYRGSMWVATQRVQF